MSLQHNLNVKSLQTLQIPHSNILSCDLAPNFTLVTGSSNKLIRIWDWIIGSGYVERKNSPLKIHKYQVTCVRISPKGSMMASASVDGTAILWNLDSLANLYTMTQVNGDPIRVCRFAPDSSILATGGDNGAICIWDLVHRSLIRTLFEHEGSTQSLAFTPDSQLLLSACSLETIRVWYVQDLIDTTTCDKTYRSLTKIDNVHDLGIICIDISKQIQVNENDPLMKCYTLATCGNSNEIKIWQITLKLSPLKKNTLNIPFVSINYRTCYNGHYSSVTCLTYNNSGTCLISSSLDKFVKIWDNEGNCIATLKGHGRYVTCVALSKNFSILVSGSIGSNDNSIIIWDLTGNLNFDSQLFKFHRSPSISDSGLLETLLKNENDDKIELLEKIDDFDGSVNCCCFNSYGLLATASGDKRVRLFQLNNYSLEECNYSPLEGHTYAVNHTEFNKDGNLLASCSLDGSIIIWNIETGEEFTSLPSKSSSIRTCRFSSTDKYLVTASDDEKASVWEWESLNEIAVLDNHFDAVTSAGYSPDDILIATTSLNGDFFLWWSNTFENFYTYEKAHEFGVQNCDFSNNLEPIPNTLIENQSYLLATCGNDSLVKLWLIILKENNKKVDVKLWRELIGHGSNVVCVRFSPVIGEILCSTATDRQARIWSVYSTDCLHVLDHDSIVTACYFTYDCSLLAVGCIDKTLWLWKLPQQLAFRSVVANKMKCRTKALINWTTNDFIKWLKIIKFDGLIECAQQSQINGQQILQFDEETICTSLNLNNEQTVEFIKELKWLKQENSQYINVEIESIPDEFLCPITQEIMREPVICSDGFTYEKNAIVEWFMAGKNTSPITNEILDTTEYSHNQDLKNSIHSFLVNSQ